MSNQLKIKRPVGRPPTGIPTKTIRIPIALEKQVKQLVEQYHAIHANGSL